MNNKDSYNIKKINHFNNIDKKYNNETLQKLIIQSEKITKPNINIQKVVEKKEKDNEKDYEKSRKNRVNNPYKCIIKDFNYDKKIEKDKDLIIYKVNENDKNKELFDKKFKKHTKTKKKETKEIEDLYGLDKKNKHMKAFDYNHKYKYRTKIEDVDDDSNLRTDRVEYYKREQEKVEENKQKIDNILMDLIDNGAISDNLDTINYDKINSEDFEQKLKLAFGEEEFNKLYDELKK
jgi:hypothetical protein